MEVQAHIGTSGFTYDHWREVFYPEELPKRQWLEYYAKRFETVEINSTFYHMPGEKVCNSWRRRTPEGFCFVVKLNRFITHRKRLIECGELLDSFVSAVEHLGAKLGPILVQLPPRWQADPERLKSFLKICAPRGRWAVEFRDPSWLCEEVYSVLRKRRAALVVHDLIDDHPREVTADFVYLRFHGPGESCAGCYPSQALQDAAASIKSFLSAGLEVFAYFNNDVGGYAVRNAIELKELILE